MKLSQAIAHSLWTLALALTPIGIRGQTYQVFHNFPGLAEVPAYGASSNADGALPEAGLTIEDGTLYGTAPYGGTNYGGTVFRVKGDGSGFAVLKHFSRLNVREASTPRGGLVLSGSTLYGTTVNGGSNTLVHLESLCFL